MKRYISQDKRTVRTIKRAHLLLHRHAGKSPQKSAELAYGRKQDDEYKRYGICSLLIAYDLDRGQRYLQVRDRCTQRDYAEFMHWLATTHYADVAKIQVVQDNLNTHTYSASYLTFPVAQAHALKHKFEFHFTPKHASWLNMVEIELSGFARQCAGLRFDSRSAFEQDALACAEHRNRTDLRIA